MKKLMILMLAICFATISNAQTTTNVQFGWGSTDIRYDKDAVPALDKRLELKAWRGERVQAQAVVACPESSQEVTLEVSNLMCGKSIIPAESIKKHLVCYTWSDDGKGDSCIVADGLKEIHNSRFSVNNLVSPLWFDICVPQEAKAGKYKGTITALVAGKKFSLPLTINVLDRVLPAPDKWAFHLDLWQNPYAVARYYDVPLWSEKHFELMRPTMELLASAGQKVITCSIFQHPWNSQTEDPFESMIGKTYTLDGQWKYDYRVFDRWVEFMMDCGITEQIDCYTILPWHLTFEYYDEARNISISKQLQPGSTEYEAYLLPFLKDFSRHLREKGWFRKTCLAMDERPKDLLEPAFQITRKADPDFRIEGAINYFGPDMAERMYDVSFYYLNELLDKKVVEEHLSKDKRITFYTCCGPQRPNTFTFSLPAESTYMGWHAAAACYSGYLRWAYNSWVKDPWNDSRFRTWPSGDCFLVYPGGSSIRMQRLIEGIQDYEKIRILRQELPADQLTRLNKAIDQFSPVQMDADFDINAAIQEARATLNEL